MKNLKKLTYNERKIVQSWGLDPSDWMRERVVDGYILIRNKVTNEARNVPARVKGR